MTRRWQALLTLAIALVVVPANARTEYVLHTNGQVVPNGEVCFYNAGPGTAPGELWFYSNDVRCFPANTLLDHPVARLQFFGRAPGLISGTGSMLINKEEQHPKSYKRVSIDLVPSATVDATTIALAAGESLAILAAATSTTNGIVIPVPGTEHRTQVPAGVPLLAVKVARRSIVSVSEPFTVAAGKTGTPSFHSPDPPTGIVVAWLKIPNEVRSENVIPEEIWDELRTHLDCGSTRRTPIWDIRHSQIASGQLQIFTNVPPGQCTARVDGDQWQPAETSITAVAGTVTTAAEPLEAVPAGIITADYQLPPGPVPVTAPIAKDCAATPAAPEITIDLFSCAERTPECRTATKNYTGDRPATFARLKPGTYWLRATHPTLGAATGTASVRYNGRVHTTITPEAFPLFGRVTKGGKPVRATLAFSQHGSPVFATTDDDGRYEVLLRDQPDATINVTLCATHAELTHRATTRPVANSAFDIALPDAHVVVTVQDATTGASIAGARITGAASLEKEDEDTLHVLRATSDEKGKGEITTDPAWWWKICATNPATGYLEQACSGPLRLRDDESREVTLRLQKTGTVKARVLPLPHARGARLYHARAGTLLSTITIPADGEVWLREQPAPGDYFTYTSPAAPLSLIVQWAKDGETLVLTAPAATGVPLRITASDTARSGRLVGLRIQGVPVPSRALERHLMTRGINVTAPWPANAIVIPDVAAGGTVSVTLGPAQLPVGFPDNADLFAAANFASTYPTVEARNGAAVFP